MVSLGCPKNLVDGEVMLGHLTRRGHRLVADAREADVIIVNTCAFIDRAKQESIDAILEMAREKETGNARSTTCCGRSRVRPPSPTPPSALRNGSTTTPLRAS
jgi:ribosomal protein S12 methylthiotransferase